MVTSTTLTADISIKVADKVEDKYTIARRKFRKYSKTGKLLKKDFVELLINKGLEAFTDDDLQKMAAVK